MGIPGIVAWLEKNYPASITPLEGGGKAAKRLQREQNGNRQDDAKSQTLPLQYHNVYIDLNSILHVVGRKAKTEQHCVKKLFRALDDIIKGLLAPQHHVYLAIDGPAPLAKLFLQRQRRMAAGKKQKEGRFDSRSFTPGTQFMNQLDEFLSFYSCRYLSTSTRNVPRLAITISGASVAGEGELKIIQHINTQPKATSNTTAIVGSDGDILLQTLLSRSPNTHVINHDAGTVFSPDAMLQSLQKHFPNRDAPKVARDWACLVLLRGSDYLPKLPHTTLNKLWRQYSIFVRKRPSEYLVVEEQTGDLKLNISMLGTILGGENWRDGAVWKTMTAYDLESRHRRFDDDGGADTEDEDDAEENDSEAADVVDESDFEESGDDDGVVSDDVSDDEDGADDMIEEVLGRNLPRDSTEGDDEDDEEVIVFEPAVRRMTSATSASPPAMADVLLSAPDVTSNQSASGSPAALYLSGVLWILRMYQTGVPSTYSFNYPSVRGPTVVTVLKYLKAAEEGTEARPVCPSIKANGFLLGSDAMHPLVCAAMLLGDDGKHLLPEEHHPLINICGQMEKSGMDYKFLTQLHSTLPADSKIITQSVTYRNLPKREDEDVSHFMKHWPKTPEGFSFEFRRVFVRELGGMRSSERVGDSVDGSSVGWRRAEGNAFRGRGGPVPQRGAPGRGSQVDLSDRGSGITYGESGRHSYIPPGRRTINLQQSWDPRLSWQQAKGRRPHFTPNGQAAYGTIQVDEAVYPQAPLSEGALRCGRGGRGSWRGRGGGVRGRVRGRGEQP